MCHGELGTFAEGRVLGEEGLRIAEEWRPREPYAGLSTVLGLLALRQGDLDHGPPSPRTGLGICRCPDSRSFSHDGGGPGRMPWLQGRIAEAVRCSRRR